MTREYKAFIISALIAMIGVVNLIMSLTLSVMMIDLRASQTAQKVNELDDSVYYYAKSKCAEAGDASDEAILKFVENNYVKCDSIQSEGLQTFWAETISSSDIINFTEDSANIMVGNDTINAKIEKTTFNLLVNNKSEFFPVLTYDCGDYYLTLE